MWKSLCYNERKGIWGGFVSLERLQEKIRKRKMPLVLDFVPAGEKLPQCVLEHSKSWLEGYFHFALELLERLKGVVPGVRFSFSGFAMEGPEGLLALSRLTEQAKRLGYCVLLTVPEAMSSREAEHFAETFFAPQCPWPFDILVTSTYLGTDSVRPYVEKLKDSNRDLLVVVRTGNKSAPELQDLLTGGRLVHMAAADKINRLAQELVGRWGYSRIGLVAAPGAGESLRTLRSKYPQLFFLLDSYDYNNVSAKKCAAAFDKYGHGAAVLAGTKISQAWLAAQTDGYDYAEQAALAVERIQRNLTGSVTIL